MIDATGRTVTINSYDGYFRPVFFGYPYCPNICPLSLYRDTIAIAQIDSATVLNLSVALEPADEKWRVNAGTNNTTDELYATGGNSSLTTGSGYAEIAFARPREYSISFTYNF